MTSLCVFTVMYSVVQLFGFIYTCIFWNTYVMLTIIICVNRNTKDMLISFHRDKITMPTLTPINTDIEKVNIFKILGVWMSQDMTWKHHIEDMHRRPSPRLYYLRQMRRCGIQTKDLITFYKSVICPLLEYACPA